MLVIFKSIEKSLKYQENILLIEICSFYTNLQASKSKNLQPGVKSTPYVETRLAIIYFFKGNAYTDIIALL